MTDHPTDPTLAEPSSVALKAALARAEVDGDLAAQNVLAGKLGRALLDENEALPALAYFEQGVKIAQQLDDKESGARHLANQGLALGQIGNYTLAMRAFRKAYGFARELSDDPLTFDLLLRMAELERARKNPESAIGHLEEALDIANRHRSISRALRVHLEHGQASWDLDETDVAVEHFETALRLARDAGDIAAQGQCLNTLGAFARSRRDMKGAADYFAAALALSPAALSKPQRLALLAQLGDIRFSQGEFDASRELFTEGLTIAQSLGDRVSECRILGSLGLIAADLGDSDEALRLANQGVALARELGDARLQGEQLLYQSMALSDHGLAEQSLEACDAAIALFESIEASSLVQKAYELREKLVSEPADDAEDL